MKKSLAFGTAGDGAPTASPSPIGRSTPTRSPYSRSSTTPIRSIQRSSASPIPRLAKRMERPASGLFRRRAAKRLGWESRQLRNPDTSRGWTWSPNGHELLIQRLNRLQNRDRYVLADVRTGRQRTVFTDSDAAWVDAWGENDTSPEAVHWLDGGQSFLAMSERDGWRHLYAVSAFGGNRRLLTSGNYDVDSVAGVRRGAPRGLFHRRRPTAPSSGISTRSDWNPAPLPRESHRLWEGSGYSGNERLLHFAERQVSGSNSFLTFRPRPTRNW